MRPPLSVHWLVIDKFRAKDPLTKEPVRDAALDLLQSAMTKAQNYAEEISELPDSIMADRIYSKETNAKKLRKEVRERADQADRVLQDAATKALAVLARVKSEIAAPPDVEPDSHEADLEAEVRAHLRTLNDKDRAAVFADAVKRDDMVTIGAVLRSGVPVMLTGMAVTEREARRREWQRSRYPVEVDRVERLAKAIEANQRAGRAVRDFAGHIAGSV